MSDKKATTAHELAAAFGYLTEKEVTAIKRLVKKIPHAEPTIVNIGAGAGTSGLAIREASAGARLYTIDHSKGGPLGGLRGESNAFRDAGRVREKPIQLLGESHEFAEVWNFGQIDMIFIDDGHTEYNVRGDIELWYPHVRQGGIMAFHDYGAPRWPAVKEVVDELMDGLKVILHVDSVIGFWAKPL